MLKFNCTRIVLAVAMSTACLVLSANALQRGSGPLQTGWHDELTARDVSAWTWNQADGRADLSTPPSGAMRVGLGDNSTKAVTNKDTWYWATCSRFATVDLD